MRFAAFALLLIAAPSWGAVVWDWGCDNNTANDTNYTISPASNREIVGSWLTCLKFASGDSTFFSHAFQVASQTATIFFDPDTGGTSTDTSRIKVRQCRQAATVADAPTSNQGRTCVDFGGALTGTSTLDGTEGHADVQNQGLRVGPGVYVIEVTAACGGSACSVTIQGEGKQP